MYWTLELASKLEDAPWPATKEELIDYATRSGAPLEVLENLQEIEDEGDVYESIEDIWPDYPSKDDFLKSKVKTVQLSATRRNHTFLYSASRLMSVTTKTVSSDTFQRNCWKSSLFSREDAESSTTLG